MLERLIIDKREHTDDILKKALDNFVLWLVILNPLEKLVRWIIKAGQKVKEVSLKKKIKMEGGKRKM